MAAALNPTAARTHAGAGIAAFAVLLLALAAVFLPSVRSMWQVYMGGETYTHGALVPLVTLWLVWRRREVLRPLPVRPMPFALLPVAACGFAWMVGRLAGVNALEHFAVVGAVPCLVLLVFGWAITRQLLFPLGFLFFAVPFGDFLMPWLIDRTADFTVMAVKLSGVPVMREGRHFVLPTGSWSVVEACSGLRYLLAAIPLGCLYAYLSYESQRTRVLFVAITIAVALVANWIRAYIIVMLGHLSDMRIATGVDHLIYGWLFFGVVMGLAFWLGNYLPDRAAGKARAPSPAGSPAAPASAARDERARLMAVTAAGVALLAAWPALASQVRGMGAERLQLDALRTALAPPSAQADDYLPGYARERARIQGRSPQDADVGVLVLRYARQDEGAEMIGYGNTVTPPEDGPGPGRWRIMQQAVVPAAALPAAPSGAEVNEYQVSDGSRRFLVWEWFWVNGGTVNSPREVKIATARSLLAGRGDESAAWLLWAPLDAPVEATRVRLAAEAARLQPAAAQAGF